MDPIDNYFPFRYTYFRHLLDHKILRVRVYRVLQVLVFVQVNCCLRCRLCASRDSSLELAWHRLVKSYVCRIEFLTESGHPNSIRRRAVAVANHQSFDAFWPPVLQTILIQYHSCASKSTDPRMVLCYSKELKVRFSNVLTIHSCRYSVDQESFTCRRVLPVVSVSPACPSSTLPTALTFSIARSALPFDEL